MSCKPDDNFAEQGEVEEEGLLGSRLEDVKLWVHVHWRSLWSDSLTGRLRLRGFVFPRVLVAAETLF